MNTARRSATVALATTALVLGGCYERVIRTKQGAVTTEVAKPDFDEKQGALDELMWGPVPKGQDPETYYRKKKRIAEQ